MNTIERPAMVELAEIKFACLVLDIETLSTNTTSGTIFDVAIGFGHASDRTLERELDFSRHIKRTLVKPDLSNADIDTVKFHEDLGHYTKEEMEGSTESAIEPKDLIPWLANAIEELFCDFGLTDKDSDDGADLVLKEHIRNCPVMMRHPEFDVSFLQNYANKYGQELPWKYWNVKDLATMQTAAEMVAGYDMLEELNDRKFTQILSENMPADAEGEGAIHKALYEIYSAKHTAISDVAWELRQAYLFTSMLEIASTLVEANKRQSEAMSFFAVRERMIEQKKEYVDYFEMKKAYDDPEISSTALN